MEVDLNLASSFSYLVVIPRLFPQEILRVYQASKQIIILVATMSKDWKKREEIRESFLISFLN